MLYYNLISYLIALFNESKHKFQAFPLYAKGRCNVLFADLCLNAVTQRDVGIMGDHLFQVILCRKPFPRKLSIESEIRFVVHSQSCSNTICN